MDRFKTLGNELGDIVLSRDDIKMAARNVTLRTISPLKSTLETVVGIGNSILTRYIRKKEGEDVENVLNSGVVETGDDLGALGMYEVQEFGGSGRISILQNYLYNPLHSLAIYLHEGGHKIFDRGLGYSRKLNETVHQTGKAYGQLAAHSTASLGHYLEEGLVDLCFRLKLLGENGMKSAYQAYGFVDAAAYALERSGGKIKNLINRLPYAIDDFLNALIAIQNHQVKPRYA